ncbi:MAG TPA: TetR/AcrR family transcriptional regulator, partial [Microthrixaceae bacterium]|nr:TetR/AcrR family transcriptional regulator [Microthrixaceae bacterium]
QSRAPGPGRPRDPLVDRAILDAAVELLSDGGIEAMTMESVATRAGVSRASVYRRYANRVDLMEAAFHAAAEQKPEPPDTGDVRRDLVQLLTRLSTLLMESDTGAVLPAMLAAARENAEVREALERFTSERRSPTITVLRRGVDRGEIRADVDPELMADALVGAVIYGLLMRNAGLGPRRVVDLVDLVLAGAAA